MDIINSKYNMLTVLKRCIYKTKEHGTIKQEYRYLCVCDCGRLTVLPMHKIVSETRSIKSCGCDSVNLKSVSKIVNYAILNTERIKFDPFFELYGVFDIDVEYLIGEHFRRDVKDIIHSEKNKVASLSSQLYMLPKDKSKLLAKGNLRWGFIEKMDYLSQHIYGRYKSIKDNINMSIYEFKEWFMHSCEQKGLETDKTYLKYDNGKVIFIDTDMLKYKSIKDKAHSLWDKKLSYDFSLRDVEKKAIEFYEDKRHLNIDVLKVLDEFIIVDKYESKKRSIIRLLKENYISYSLDNAGYPIWDNNINNVREMRVKNIKDIKDMNDIIDTKEKLSIRSRMIRIKTFYINKCKKIDSNFLIYKNLENYLMSIGIYPWFKKYGYNDTLIDLIDHNKGFVKGNMKLCTKKDMKYKSW